MKSLRIHIIAGVLLILSAVLSSCTDDNVYFVDSKPMEGMIWNYKNPVSFEFDIDDTVNYFDFYLDLRITTSYGWNNCYTFVTLESPSMLAQDTINIPLADVSGQWRGEVSGSMVENRVLFMKNVRFHELGHHKITFVQGMREDNLMEVSDVGLTIKTVE